MRIYREVLIESAEQAEALPAGTILRTTLTINLDPTEYIDATAFRAGDVWWSDGKVIATSDLIGWTALVPISVEDLIRDTVTETLAEQARQKAEADRKRREFDEEVRRRAEEQYLTRPYPATQFNRLGEP